jgi:hypothetical protein
VYELSWDGPGDAWFTVEIPDWQVQERLFFTEGTGFEIIGDPSDFEELFPICLNGHCPDDGLTDAMYKFHSWGAFTVRIDADSPNPLEFVFLQMED